MIDRVSRLYSKKCFLNQNDIELLIKTFIKEIDDEPIPYKAHVEIVGLIIVSNSIKISDEIILRQPKVEDFETEYIVPMGNILKRSPSAILNIEILGKSFGEVQEYLIKGIAVLRLFKVGSVKEIDYSITSDSILDLPTFGGITSSIP